MGSDAFYSYFSSASITKITNHPSFRGLFFMYCFDTYNSYLSSAFVNTTPTILQVKASSSATTLIPTATILFFCFYPQYDCQSTNIPFRSFFFIYYFAEIYCSYLSAASYNNDNLPPLHYHVKSVFEKRRVKKVYSGTLVPCAVLTLWFGFQAFHCACISCKVTVFIH